MKKCGKCQEEKETSEFHNWRQGKDGLCKYCKGCVSNDRKRYLLENGEEVRKRRREIRASDPNRFRKNARDSYLRNIESRKERQRSYNEKNREKINERQRVYNLKNRLRINENQRSFWRSEEGISYANEYYHRTKEKFDSKIKARNTLRYAVKTGKIMKPDNCEICLVKCAPQAHHEDYSQPLNVQWVCSYCHKKLHK